MPMKSFTTSSHLNLRTLQKFDASSSGRSAQGVRPSVVRRAKRLLARTDYPTRAEIEYLTQQVITAILAASRGTGPENPAD
jgi:hypothetical protein